MGHGGPRRRDVVLAGSLPSDAPDLDHHRARIITGHAFIQNQRRGHYELGLHARTPQLDLAAAFDELAVAI